MTTQNIILPKDQELLNKMQNINPIVNDLEFNDNKKIILLQTEATLRNRKTMVDLDKSNNKLSFIMLCLVFIQIAIAMFDSVFQIIAYPDKAKSYVYLVMFFIPITMVLIMMYKDSKKQ